MKQGKKDRDTNKWILGKEELVLFSLYCATGITASFYGARLLDGFPYNFGRNVAGLFAPPFFCLVYLSYTGYRYGLHSKVLVKTLVLYCIQIIPYIPLFAQVFEPTGPDDFYRYHLYARNMFENSTLWGGDKLFFKEAGYHYVTQPGYRYFVYLELLLFRDLYRFVSFVNIGLYILTVYFFQKSILQTVKSNRLKVTLLVLIVLFTPYMIKNLLMGLPEWLTVILLMLACYFYLVPQNGLIAAFLLGLVPFFRQNLLIAVLLIFVCMLIHSRRKLRMITLFILPLLLPLYHNLYYAGEWRFFVDVFHLPFLTYSESSEEPTGLKFSLIIANIIHYFGFDIENGKVFPSYIAVLFLPFATVLYFYFIKFLPEVKLKLFFVLVTMSAIVPAILLGSAYYPRFEFINVAVSLVTFLTLYFNYSKQ
jgi:hypothetical protein